VFEQVNRIKAAARANGADIIDLGMGSLDELGYPYWDESDNPAYRSFLNRDAADVTGRL